ncbi:MULTISPECIES: hypothetical protein [Mesorhizobium]|uniref:Uncharacterized protein n=1 Tax=Mesorhizobium abyssinicae TaxID=1209958 RepID=A0ABU5AGE5_9HYPH|nr:MULTISPECIES: hypothetical protein [Mesorhizobium]RVC44887.1 hypothetical protein EN779_33090 [Mesorhizobium sp. M4B.F.Ca.ET.088.02.2.1]MDX8432954.1 hypothetical protein [Mesorhizobium abyssinicae]MDX8536350.1 hypothetical protein [Mesorhizobium abyssinicae]RUW27940.1 hypothetical protein EOA34_02930 [Mesorhizobium sp. M4B.F.Ca.ET.013.02.1.1]RUW70959.1 hypothetical protein EOA31_19025 [Mesorhizobium sp. M4B.F.Ca.ET.049.02.1.2]
MNRQAYAKSREIIVASAIEQVIAELRLIDVADYIAFIRLEHFACLSDLVDSAAELFFMPGTLRLGHGGEAHVDWSGSPRIVLDLELRPPGVTVYFQLTLSEDKDHVVVNYVSFEKPGENPEHNTALLEAVIEQARIRRTEPLAY